jgi:hypothetical protein
MRIQFPAEIVRCRLSWGFKKSLPTALRSSIEFTLWGVYIQSFISLEFILFLWYIHTFKYNCTGFIAFLVLDSMLLLPFSYYFSQTSLIRASYIFLLYYTCEFYISRLGAYIWRYIEVDRVIRSLPPPLSLNKWKFPLSYGSQHWREPETQHDSMHGIEFPVFMDVSVSAEYCRSNIGKGDQPVMQHHISMQFVFNPFRWRMRMKLKWNSFYDIKEGLTMYRLSYVKWSTHIFIILKLGSWVRIDEGKKSILAALSPASGCNQM